jgi:membrane protein
MTPYWKILRQTATEFLDDDALRLSAALSYYAAFSLAPLLLIAIAVAGWVLGDEAVRGQVDDHLRGSLGSAGATALQDMIAHARKPEKNMVASALGVAMLLFGAGGVFGQLQEALNTVWGVKRRSGRGWKGLVKDRFLSFAMVLGTGFLLLTSMIASAILQGVSDYVGSILSLPPAVWAVISGVASFFVIAALFAAIFKLLPDVRIGWRDVFPGAVFTALLFSVGKAVMAWYLGREATASAYGATGALALVLLWVYYSSIILLFGAEFTQVATVERCRSILPDRDAVLVDETRGPAHEPVAPATIPAEVPAHAVVPRPTAVTKPPVELGRASPGPLVWMTGTLMPAIAGWSLAPVIKSKVGLILRRSPLLRTTVEGLGDFRSKHPKLLKLAVLGTALAVRHRRKSKAG